MKRVTGLRTLGAAVMLTALDSCGGAGHSRSRRCRIDIVHQIRNAPLSLRQGTRHGRHGQGRHQHHDQHRLRRRPGVLGASRSRPRDGRRRQGDGRLVQRPGRHSGAQDRGRLRKRRRDQRRLGGLAGVQAGLHAGGRGVRPRRRGGTDPPGLQPGCRAGLHRLLLSWRTRTRCTRRPPTRPTRARCRAPTRPRSCSARRPRRWASTAPPSPPSSPRRTRRCRHSPRPAGSSSPDCVANIDYNGEANYTPFVQKLQSCGAQIVFNDATPGATLYGAFESENQIGYDPIWVMDSGAYTAGLRQVEHRWPGQQRLRPPLLRAPRSGQGRPGRVPVPGHRQEVRRPDLAAG